MSIEITDERLQHLLELEKKRTPGEWAEYWQSNTADCCSEYGIRIAPGYYVIFGNEPDATVVREAVNNLAPLCRELLAARKRLRAAENVAMARAGCSSIGCPDCLHLLNIDIDAKLAKLEEQE